MKAIQKLKKLIKTHKYKLIFTIYLSIIFIGMLKTYFSTTVETFSGPLANKVILLDAGHGGFDPGKVGKDNTLEKEINLNIMQKLQKYLEQSGAFVLTTRVDDTPLSGKKREDLKQRKNMANEKNVNLMVSIHQNSFPKEGIKGAQVFYYKTSEESKKLAESIQNRLKEIDSTNNRLAKSSLDYYLLKETKIPSIIIECGFLSNPNERDLLKTKEYQEKIAWYIYVGILDYFKSN